jgi:hypothetical protein
MHQKSLINGALAGYAEYFTGAPLGDLVWAPSIFIAGDTHQRLTGPIDITGRSRCLIYGPYIRLPPGDGTLMSPWPSPSRRQLGFYHRRYYHNSAQFDLDQCDQSRGAQTRLPIVYDPANESVVEVRVSSNQAAFEGRLSLGAVTVRPQQGAPKKLLELVITASHVQPPL